MVALLKQGPYKTGVKTGVRVHIHTRQVLHQKKGQRIYSLAPFFTDMADAGMSADRPLPLAAAPAMPCPVPPTSGPERIELLDALRGFALPGVLMVNLRSLSLYDLLPNKNGSENISV